LWDFKIWQKVALDLLAEFRVCKFKTTKLDIDLGSVSFGFIANCLTVSGR
jgi:hypothetical protein